MSLASYHVCAADHHSALPGCGEGVLHILLLGLISGTSLLSATGEFFAPVGRLLENYYSGQSVSQLCYISFCFPLSSACSLTALLLNRLCLCPSLFG